MSSSTTGDSPTPDDRTREVTTREVTTREGTTAVGTVPTEGRGDLPQVRLRGESLESLATSALSQAGVAQISRDMPWAQVQGLELAVVLHDPLCPMTPASFLADALASSATGDVVVGCRPVTDTIKSATGEIVGETVDRDGLLAITSPVVLPPPVVAALTDWPDTTDFAALVTSLRGRFAVRFVEAPPLGRRVEDMSAVLVLEAFAELHAL